MTDPTNAALARDLLAAVAPFRLSSQSGSAPHGPGLFSYCALSRERLSAVRLTHPVLAVLMSGTKEVWRGLHQEQLPAGTLFALPGGVDLEVVNDPDPRSGIYQSLILEITPDMIPDVLPGPTSARGAHAAIALRPALIEAVAHAAAAIAAGPAASSIRRARVAELLALVSEDPAAQVLFSLSVAERVGQLVRARPAHPWRSAAVARSLGLSESTFRRRLRAEGRQFAEILRGARMQIAHQMLDQGLASGLVAATVGYASRTHFAGAYKAVFGELPRDTARG